MFFFPRNELKSTAMKRLGVGMAASGNNMTPIEISDHDGLRADLCFASVEDI